jgi:hypothetical protein
MIELLLTKETIAIIAIIMTLVGYEQYMRNIFRGHTKPHMFSWIIWATLTAIAYFAQLTDNPGPGAWITGLTAAISFIIVALAYFKGEKDYTRSDWLTFLAGVAALPIWIITENALWAVIIVSLIDAAGFWPTFRKSWTKPHEETAFHYLMAGTKFILAIIALENYTWVTVLYPASLVFMNGAFLMLLFMRRKVIPLVKEVAG